MSTGQDASRSPAAQGVAGFMGSLTGLDNRAIRAVVLLLKQRGENDERVFPFVTGQSAATDHAEQDDEKERANFSAPRRSNFLLSEQNG